MEIKMICEYEGCKETKGRDYINPNPEQGWEGEPIYLCDKHAVGFQPYLGTDFIEPQPPNETTRTN